MKFQKVLHDLDSLSEELGIVTKQNYEFILANLNWEKGANNELTQFGCKLSNLYSFNMLNHKNIKLAEKIPTIVDNLLSNLNKGSLTLLEETLLSQSRKLFLDQVHEFFSGIDMITERIGHLKALITLQMQGHCDPVVMHYLEKGDAGQQHILKIMLGLLYPNGYEGTCTPKATDSQNTEIVSSSTTCDSVTVTDEPKNDSSITDSHVQRKHFDTGSKSIICTPKATDSQDTEIVSSCTTCDSVTVTDEPKNDSSITDSHVQRKYFKRGSKYKSKANWTYETSQKLKFPRVSKRISKPMKMSKGENKNKSTSKIKIGYIHKSNLNYFSNAMTFYNTLLLKRPRVKFKNKLY